MDKRINLIDLSTETLVHILQYCSLNDLYQLQQTCKRLFYIINTSTNLYNGHFVVTNQLNEEMRKRSFLMLSIKERYEISKKWRNGNFKEIIIFKEHAVVFPWIVLKKNFLWSSKRNTIFGYKRNKSHVLQQKPTHKIELPGVADFWKFVYKNNCFMAGLDDGSFLIHIDKNQSNVVKNAHTLDVYTVDFHDRVLASGSKDGTVKIWNGNCDLSTISSKTTHSTFDFSTFVRSIQFSKQGNYLGVGTDRRALPPLHIIDVEKSSVVSSLAPKNSTSHLIHHVKWENANVILSAGYDGYVRCWDIRTGSCVNHWLDPLVASVFCFETDNFNTLITGTENCGRIVLWDMRQTTALQMYFVANWRRSFPIYSLTFDATNLFAVSDKNLTVLNFTTNTNVGKNYSMFCDYLNKIII